MNQIQKFGFTLSIVALSGVMLAGCSNTPNSPGSGSNGNADNQTNVSASSTSNGKNVTIGYVNWDEDVATSYLWKNLLSSKGYHVELKSLEAGPLFAGLSEGGVDVFFDTWLPTTHKTYMDHYGSQLTDLGKWYQGQTEEGFVVPTYMKDINSISDLKKHASEFGNQIVGIDPGAGEMGLAKQAISDYGLNLNLVQSSSPAMLSSLEKAYQAHQPVVVTLWSPHWAFAKYQLKYLSDPKGDFGKPGWIQTEANTKWVNANTQVADWIKNFKLTPNQLGTLEEDINNASSKDAGVTKWIEDNQDLVNSWFN
jgi:glycine betaine/proline transport system substrate-binding protein